LHSTPLHSTPLHSTPLHTHTHTQFVGRDQRKSRYPLHATVPHQDKFRTVTSVLHTHSHTHTYTLTHTHIHTHTHTHMHAHTHAHTHARAHTVLDFVEPAGDPLPSLHT